MLYFVQHKTLQDNVDTATKIINDTQRLLGDSIALVKNKELLFVKLQSVLKMDSYLHCDEMQPIK